MLYVQQSLAPDEELIHVGNFHWMYSALAISNIIWGTLFCIMIIVAALFIESTGTIPLSSYDPGPDAGWLRSVQALHPGIKLIAVFMFLMGFFRFGQLMVAKATTEIAITTSRLVYKRGLVARYVGEMSIDRIEGVNVLQGVMGRLFGYGRVVVRGMGVGEVILPPIENPIAFRKAIEQARMG